MAKTADPKTLVKDLTARPTPPAYALILCPDQTRRDRIRDLLLKRGAGPGPELQRVRAEDLSETKFPAFRDSLLSPSLFSPVQYFSIEGVEGLKPPVARQITELLEGRELPGVHAIFSGSSLPTNSVFRKLFAQQSVVIEIKELTGIELRKWVGKELERAGISSFSPAACEAVIQVSDEDPDQIGRIAQHLADYLDGSPLTDKAVFEVFIGEPDPDQYKLLEGLKTRGLARTEVEVGQLIRGGKHPLALLALLSRTILQYLVIQGFQKQGLSKGDGLKLLKLPPWLYDKLAIASKRYSVDRLRNAADATVRADSKLKGRAIGGEEPIAELLRSLV